MRNKSLKKLKLMSKKTPSKYQPIFKSLNNSTISLNIRLLYVIIIALLLIIIINLNYLDSIQFVTKNLALELNTISVQHQTNAALLQVSDNTVANIELDVKKIKTQLCEYDVKKDKIKWAFLGIGLFTIVCELFKFF